MEIIVPLIGILAAFLTIMKDNWCEVQISLCAGREHIACLPNSFPYSKQCENVTLLHMNDSLKATILDYHNHFRNEIALGRIGNFPQAKRMGVMKWDDTLQYLAEQHVSHCTFAHDQCRATHTYPRSGQNIFLQGTFNVYPNATDAVVRGINAWFEEWKDARVTVVDRITEDQSKAFHFTVMVNDQNNRVGCGMIKYLFRQSNDYFDGIMLTCNYQYTNVLDEAMYSKGPPCSACTTPCSRQYPGLCSS